MEGGKDNGARKKNKKKNKKTRKETKSTTKKSTKEKELKEGYCVKGWSLDTVTLNLRPTLARTTRSCTCLIVSPQYPCGSDDALNDSNASKIFRNMIASGVLGDFAASSSSSRGEDSSSSSAGERASKKRKKKTKGKGKKKSKKGKKGGTPKKPKLSFVREIVAQRSGGQNCGFMVFLGRCLAYELSAQKEVGSDEWPSRRVRLALVSLRLRGSLSRALTSAACIASHATGRGARVASCARTWAASTSNGCSGGRKVERARKGRKRPRIRAAGPSVAMRKKIAERRSYPLRLSFPRFWELILILNAAIHSALKEHSSNIYMYTRAPLCPLYRLLNRRAMKS